MTLSKIVHIGQDILSVRKWGYPQVTIVVSILSHGHPWLGWFGGYPHDETETAISGKNEDLGLMCQIMI